MSLTSEQLQRKVAGLNNLPTLPSVVRNLSRLVEDQKSSAADIGELIAKDQVISAKILRLVNSPAYGFPGRISSITHALVLLGFNVVKGLVLGTTVFDSFGDKAKKLWEHSLGCAFMSRRIAKELNIQDVEEVMIAGLLHDLGKAVISFLAPTEFARILEIAEEDHCHIAVVEREFFGVDHAMVASWVCEQWHLPERLREAISLHHRPDSAKKGGLVTSVVHVADILSRGMGYGFPGDISMPPLSHTAFQSLGLSYEQIDSILQLTEMEFKAGGDIFAAGDAS